MTLQIGLSSMLLKSTADLSGRNIVISNPVRFQSSFTFLNNHNLLLKRQLKHSKRKLKKISSIVTTTSKYHQHTPSCDPSAGTNDPRSIPQLMNRKHKFHSLPRVPSTKHLDRNEINLSALYSGYRPMFINPRHFDASSSNNTSTLYEFSMNLEEPNSIWYNSATGLETFDEWENIPNAVMKDLKPFVPPNASGLTREKKNSEHKQYTRLHDPDPNTEGEVSGVQLSADSAEILERMAGLLKKRKGRKKPVFTLIHSKKYPHN